MFQKITFTGAGKNNYASQYLERKAAQVQADVKDSMRIAARAIINKNHQASKAGQYLPADAYFGPVPTKGREIGKKKIMDSIAITKTNIPEARTNNAESIIPENSINYIG